MSWFKITTIATLVAGIAILASSYMSKKGLVSEEYDLWGKTVRLAIRKENFPTDDEIAKMDKLMPGCEHKWFASPHENQLHYLRFLPKERGEIKKPKAIILYLHGIQDHSGNALVLKSGRKLCMSLLSQYFLEKGCALYALDLPGHGFSEGPRMFVNDWKESRDDYAAFGRMVASQHDEGTPLFVSGYSYGGCLSVHVAHMFQDGAGPKGFAGIFSISPAIIGNLPPAAVVFVLKNILAPMFPTWVPFFMPNPVTPDRIWHDKEVLEHHLDPTIRKWGLEAPGVPFSLGTARNIMDSMSSVQEVVIPSLAAPFCVVQGTHDFSVLPAGTKFLEEHAKTPKEDRLVWYGEGGYHELMGDPLAEEALDKIGEFVESRIVKMQ